MTDFNLKLTLKEKDKARFLNFILYRNADFTSFNGKIVYMNSKYPDKHIFIPYYMIEGKAYVLKFTMTSPWESPLFTLEDLNYEDPIIFYTSEDLKK